MASDPKTVVVAEDEVLVRMLAAEVLTDAGFEVIEVEHARDALAVLAAKSSTIHLLFTDINMPGPMNGLELAHHVRRTWPAIGLLIASGQGRPLFEDLPVGSRFLPKPYHPDHVVAHARTLTAS